MFITETRPDQSRARQAEKEPRRNDSGVKRRLVVGFNMYTAQMDLRRWIDPMATGHQDRKAEF
jgi:hypothetical protein